jgi:addiction module RelE/StbE family toxin
MNHVMFKPSFVRQFKKLPPDLQEEIQEAIHIFRKDPHHQQLKLHKLQGKLQGLWSFSVNYKYRIVCQQKEASAWSLVAVGDHDVYR